MNQAVPVPLLNEGFTASYPFVDRVKTRRREVDQGLPHDGPDTRFLGFRGDDVFKEVHVVETRGSRLDHLDKSKAGGNCHVFRGHHTCLCRENMLVQPSVEREIIGIPT